MNILGMENNLALTCKKFNIYDVRKCVIRSRWRKQIDKRDYRISNSGSFNLICMSTAYKISFMPVCIYVCIVDSFNVIITAYYGKTTLKEGYIFILYIREVHSTDHL